MYRNFDVCIGEVGYMIISANLYLPRPHDASMLCLNFNGLVTGGLLPGHTPIYKAFLVIALLWLNMLKQNAGTVSKVITKIVICIISTAAAL